MSLVRCVFLGTPEIARYCLKSMIKDEHYEIVGVVTQPNRPAGRKMRLQPSPVRQEAENHGIPVITPESVNTEESLETLRSWRAEVAVVVAYGQILSQRFLDLYPKRVVNVHASLLPRWRGAAPIQRSLMAGDKETGVALQVMVKKLDAGDVLGVRRIALDEELDAVELHERMMPLAADLLEVELMDYLRGNLTATPQDESQITYAPKLDKGEGQIDWRRPAREIHNCVRGMTLGPGAFTQRAGKKLKLIKTAVVDTTATNPPGEVLSVDDQSFVVACGEQALRILELQPESRARQRVVDYLRGYPLKPGDKLGEF